MAWYEITLPHAKPFVVTGQELNNFNKDERNKIKLLVFAPLDETKEVDVLAEVIDLNEWDVDDVLMEEDKDFARESARQVFAKFRVFPK